MTVSVWAALTAVATLPLAHAMQPNAVPPVPVPMRSLKWGDINFLHTTDTHGWHAGHLQESQYSADWGDYISFTAHMRERAEAAGVDLLLVDTGDRVEGNGLYDASTPKGEVTYKVFGQQNIDIICSGNHELYQAATAERERTVMAGGRFQATYLASNLDVRNPNGTWEPLAQRYRAFTTPQRGLRVVAFGFLFNFTGGANNTAVQPVQKTVQEPWFGEALAAHGGQTDLFVVIGHVGVRMQELRVVYEAVRAAHPATPIVLLGGHAHVRDAVRFDSRAVAVASGRYMETIGFVSVQLGGQEEEAKAGEGAKPEAGKYPIFHRRYIDNNLLGLYHHSGRTPDSEPPFETEHGRNVTQMITEARAQLKLDTRYGCAPRTYWLSRRAYTAADSVFSLLQEQVLPQAVVQTARAHVPRLVLLNTGAMRFDIFAGAFTRDSTYIVSPFLSGLQYIPDVPYRLARQVLGLLNSQGHILTERMAEKAEAKAEADAGLWDGRAVDWRQMGPPEQYSERRDPWPLGEAGQQQQQALSQDAAAADDAAWPRLVPGYTTWDDLGIDGDDALHSPLPYYQLPNCIQAAVFPGREDGEGGEGSSHSSDPDTVDLVFLDFIGKFVLEALSLASEAEGGVNGQPPYHYTNADVKTYLEGIFTDYLVSWIKANWKGEC